ncbi:MAG: hypothetical protein LWW85_05650 [Marinilabiliales bacterium]|nr:hypothetical protein [Marinilabiliales bacterium]
MKKLWILFLFAMVMRSPLSAQEAIPGWEKWQYLMGGWEGEGEGQPGMGKGSFTLKPKLGGSILERKGKTEMAASNGRPAFVHEDVMIVYKNESGNPSRAIYFDNENHVISYAIRYTDNQIVLTSEPMQGAPRFRLIYEKLDSKRMNTRFEMAMPNQPDLFKPYIEGISKKVKELSEMPK